MIKNLTKARFFLILGVAIFLALVILIQFIVLSVLRGQEQNLNNQLNDITSQIEEIPKDVSYDDKKDYARWELGYKYDDENVFIEQ